MQLSGNRTPGRFPFQWSSLDFDTPPSKRLEGDDVPPSKRVVGDDINGLPDGCCKDEVRRNTDDSSHNADQRSACQDSLSSFFFEGVRDSVSAGGGQLDAETAKGSRRRTHPPPNVWRGAHEETNGGEADATSLPLHR